MNPYTYYSGNAIKREPRSVRRKPKPRQVITGDHRGCLSLNRTLNNKRIENTT